MLCCSATASVSLSSPLKHVAHLTHGATADTNDLTIVHLMAKDWGCLQNRHLVPAGAYISHCIASECLGQQKQLCHLLARQQQEGVGGLHQLQRIRFITSTQHSIVVGLPFDAHPELKHNSFELMMAPKPVMPSSARTCHLI
jgi:hypothetical protein